MMSTLNLVFAGTPEFGLPCLEALYASQHHLQAIYTQPDRPAGRGRKLQTSAVKEWALNHGLPVYQPLNFRNAESISELAHLKPDVLIVIAYGLILPKAVLDIPRLGCINVHASLLPRWRGASPIQHAILYGDTESGVTLMQMDEGLDTGAMLKKVSCPLSIEETASSLHDKLSQISPQALLDVLEDLAQGRINPQVQNQDLATYASKINKEDAHINWHHSAEAIDCKIRAFNPWPVAFMLWNGEAVRIHKATCLEESSIMSPGTVISLDKKGMIVATQDKQLRIEKIQFPGGKIISIADWLNSGKNCWSVGSILS